MRDYQNLCIVSYNVWINLKAKKEILTLNPALKDRLLPITISIKQAGKHLELSLIGRKGVKRLLLKRKAQKMCNKIQEMEITYWSMRCRYRR